MKKRIIIIAMIGSMIFGGVVSAATTSLWGKYKGNDIVRVQYNGKTVTYSDVPAISYNGRVMIPVTMLGSVGVSYVWDQTNKTIQLSSYTPSNYTPTNTYNQPSTSTVKINPADLKLYSNDGQTFLGNLSTNIYDLDSIFNEYGNYGSKYSQTSITNEYGTYGSEYSDESAYNKYASKPPILTYMGQTLYYVTINTTITGGISPTSLYDLAIALE
ncbi:hypothetical protein D3C74_302820 [compost metagenome]